MKRISILFFVLCSFALSINAQDVVRKEFYGMWTIAIEDGSVGWLGVNDD